MDVINQAQSGPERNKSPVEMWNQEIPAIQPDSTQDVDLSEMSVLDAWDILDKKDESLGPSDTENPVSQRNEVIDLDYEEDVLSMDMAEDDWLEA